MLPAIHIKNSKRIYYGAIILSVLFFLHQNSTTNESLSETASGTTGVLSLVVILYSIYKIFFGKAKIIFTESGFKVRGHSWSSWDDLIAVYPLTEEDSENGSKYYIHFRLIHGVDISIRSEYLEMTFEQIAELVSRYKANYQKHNTSTAHDAT
ncbi:MAG: hypothetical protein QM791_06585 [Ferruginibacter sp.]